MPVAWAALEMRLSRRKSIPTRLVGSTVPPNAPTSNPAEGLKSRVFRRRPASGRDGSKKVCWRSDSAPRRGWRRQRPEEDRPVADRKSLLRLPAPEVERVRDNASTRLQLLHQFGRQPCVDGGGQVERNNRRG